MFITRWWPRIRHRETSTAKWKFFSLVILLFFDFGGFLVVKVNERKNSIVTLILLELFIIQLSAEETATMMLKNILLTTFSEMNEISSSVNLGYVVIYKIFNTTADTLLFACEDCALLAHQVNELFQLIQVFAQASPCIRILSQCTSFHVRPVCTQTTNFLFHTDNTGITYIGIAHL